MRKIETIIATAAHESRKFLADRSGATAVEYAMIASAIGAAIAATIYSLGSSVKSLFTSVDGVL